MNEHPVDFTCQDCKERGVPREQRLLAQVAWNLSGDQDDLRGPLGKQPQVWIYGKRLNQEAVRQGWAAPGQPASRNPLKVTSRVGMVRVVLGEPVILRCHGCATQWPFRAASHLVRTAGQPRKSGTYEVELAGPRKEGRSRR